MANRISIIVVCLNCKKELEKTLLSISLQTYSAFEVIVIDGGSTDGTIESILHYQHVFEQKAAGYKYISEKDNGIYDAMNKGITMATHEWTLFMNAGDSFAADNVLSDVFQNRTYNSEILYGNYIACYNNKKVPIKCKPCTDLYRMPSKHQAFFTKTNLLKDNKFCLDYKIVADYYWYASAYSRNVKFEYVDVYICVFDLTGVSSCKKYEAYLECEEIRQKLNIEKDIRIIRFFKKGVCKIIGFCRSKLHIFYLPDL